MKYHGEVRRTGRRGESRERHPLLVRAGVASGSHDHADGGISMPFDGKLVKSMFNHSFKNID
jgi:hypothetical protein